MNMAPHDAVSILLSGQYCAGGVVSGWSCLQLLVTFAVVALLTLLFYGFHRHSSLQLKKLNLPPGPKPLPIIGNLHQLGPIPHQTVAELTRTYGPIVFLKLGSRPVVISSDPKILTDIMKVQDHVFSSRPDTICGKTLTYEMHDFIMAPYGDHWRAMRRICVQELLSSRSLDTFAATRQEEVVHLVRAVWDQSGSSPHCDQGREGVEVDLRHKIESFAMNVMTDMVLGKKYFGTHLANQDENNEVLRLLMDSFQFFGVLNIGDFIKWLAPLDLQGYKRKLKKVSPFVCLNHSSWFFLCALHCLFKYPLVHPPGFVDLELPAVSLGGTRSYW